MTRFSALLLTIVLVIGSVSAFPMAAAAQSSSSISSAIGQSTFAQADENASRTPANVSPGERLSGVIRVGQAEFEGEMELRTYGVEFAQSASANAKADVVADRLERTQNRLDELEERKQALEEARENGEITEGEFNARMAELAARTETVKQLANASEARAKSLPADVLESKGINLTAIQTLQNNAQKLTGPDVATIARSIAGPGVGQSVTQGPPAGINVSAPDNQGDGVSDSGTAAAEAAVDRAAAQLETAETRLEQADERVDENASNDATAAIERAREDLQQARQALEDARLALDEGDHEEAVEYAENALSHAEDAEANAQTAIDEANQSGSNEVGAESPTETSDQGSASGMDDNEGTSTKSGSGGDY